MGHGARDPDLLGAHHLFPDARQASSGLAARLLVTRGRDGSPRHVHSLPSLDRHNRTMKPTPRILGLASLVLLAACKDKAAVARGDSLQGQLTQQQVLSTQ